LEPVAPVTGGSERWDCVPSGVVSELVGFVVVDAGTELGLVV